MAIGDSFQVIHRLRLDSTVFIESLAHRRVHKVFLRKMSTLDYNQIRSLFVLAWINLLFDFDISHVSDSQSILLNHIIEYANGPVFDKHAQYRFQITEANVMNPSYGTENHELQPNYKIYSKL